MTAVRRVVATIHVAGRTITGTYEGGAYIDLHFGGSKDAFDCINVWDYAKGEATIAPQSWAVKVEMKRWAEEAGASLDHDLGEYELMMRSMR